MTKPDIEIVGIEKLRPHFDMGKIMGVVRAALIQHADGKVQSPPPGQLLFSKANGDCHIKYGHAECEPTFAIKIATGFYDNPKRGLPVNHGLILVLDSATGAPITILKDDGWLTAWRTAAATVLAAEILAPKTISAIGLIGTGLQAQLALNWLHAHLGRKQFYVLSRSTAAAVAFVERMPFCNVRIARTADELFEHCNLVVTATPSTSALFDSGIVRLGTHIVAVGADSTGKQELPTELFAKVRHIVVDDVAQSLDHGDFGNAVRARHVDADKAMALGDLLSGKRSLSRARDDITVADLTGIAAEDLAIAAYFCNALRADGGGNR